MRPLSVVIEATRAPFFRTPPVRYGVLLLEVIAWLWVLRVIVRQRFESQDDPDEEGRLAFRTASPSATGPVPDPDHVPAHRATPGEPATEEPAR